MRVHRSTYSPRCRCAFAVQGGASNTAVPALFRYVNGTITPATDPTPPDATAGWWIFPGWAIFPCVAVALVVSVLVWFVLERPARAAITRGNAVAGLVAALAQDDAGHADSSHGPQKAIGDADQAPPGDGARVGSLP